MSEKSPQSSRLVDIPLTTLKGVGPKLEEKLAKLHLHNLQDLLFHLPIRYEDRTRVTPIANLLPRQRKVVFGEVLSSNVQFGRRRSLVCQIADDSGVMELRLFYFSNTQKARLIPGQPVLAFGEVRYNRGKPGMIHPEITLVPDGEEPSLDNRLTPVYPTTEGLHQLSWRKLIPQALARLDSTALPELLPVSWREQLQLPEISAALKYIHEPPVDADLKSLELATHPTTVRLAFEEMLAHHVALQQLKRRLQAMPGIAMPQENSEGQASLQNRFVTSLPFTPTSAQQRVTLEIANDMALSRPMIRLVQGDVGSGKTVVAAQAALQAIANGHQVALMAPTEILAEQHARSFAAWFDGLGIGVEFLVSKLPAKKRREVLERITKSESMMVVGTHALFQSGVEFEQLGLVIVDEQHRFGVDQRLALKDKSGALVPHQLVMTATPIPRTLAMTLYADMDVSIIDELPPGRQPVTTTAIDLARRPQVIERLANACREGRQVYWVCTLIEESDELQLQAAETSFELLRQALPEFNVALIHGRMKSAEKQHVMTAFMAGKTQLLVATTVIEVGVDVPNASLMIIENPERLGLAQLHQLRGRVGRGSEASHCILLYQSPLSENAKARLNVMRETNDGFKIAEKDLELRGPGEVLGVRQTGEIQFKFADLTRDHAFIRQVQAAAETLAKDSPELTQALIKRWLAHRTLYADV